MAWIGGLQGGQKISWTALLRLLKQSLAGGGWCSSGVQLDIF